MSNVCYIHAKPNDDFADHWYKGAGWYFADETQLLNGVYDTKEEAEEACILYALWLDEGADI